jgi:hypothetical protein
MSKLGRKHAKRDAPREGETGPEETEVILTLRRGRWGWSFARIELPRRVIDAAVVEDAPCGTLDVAQRKLAIEFHGAAARGDI